jgi:hypothetical protein
VEFITAILGSCSTAVCVLGSTHVPSEHFADKYILGCRPLHRISPSRTLSTTDLPRPTPPSSPAHGSGSTSRDNPLVLLDSDVDAKQLHSQPSAVQQDHTDDVLSKQETQRQLETGLAACFLSLLDESTLPSSVWTLDGFLDSLDALVALCIGYRLQVRFDQAQMVTNYSNCCPPSCASQCLPVAANTLTFMLVHIVGNP